MLLSRNIKKISEKQRCDTFKWVISEKFAAVKSSFMFCSDYLWSFSCMVFPCYAVKSAVIACIKSNRTPLREQISCCLCMHPILSLTLIFFHMSPLFPSFAPLSPSFLLSLAVQGRTDSGQGRHEAHQWIGPPASHFWCALVHGKCTCTWAT